MQFVTDLGDQAFILPLTVAVSGLLMLNGERRAAVWWLFSVGAALGAILVAKLFFIPCGYLIPSLDIRSPSGHAASASATYGGLAALFVQTQRSAVTRSMTVAVGVALTLAIASSRVLLEAHTTAETLLGVVIGCVAPALLTIPGGLFSRGEKYLWYWVALLPIVVIPMALGLRLRSEDWISATARWAAHWVGACGQ